jgi:hypothetical protein
MDTNLLGDDVNITTEQMAAFSDYINGLRRYIALYGINTEPEADSPTIVKAPNNGN